MSSSSETARALVFLFGGGSLWSVMASATSTDGFVALWRVKKLTTRPRLPFTLTSVLFLHNKWQQNEHDTHIYDSSLWKYSTHQTCLPCTRAPKIYIIATVKNRETSTVTEVVYVPEKVHTVFKKKKLKKTQKERRPPEGERVSDGYLYSVGVVSSKKKEKTKQ